MRSQPTAPPRSRTKIESDIVAAFAALVAIGEKHGDRSSRARAKIKMLVDRFGAQRVRDIFAEELAIAKIHDAHATLLLDKPDVRCGEAAVASIDAPPGVPVADAIAQNQAGRFTVPALVPTGELATHAARELADAAIRFGDGTVYLTPDQNALEARVAEPAVRGGRLVVIGNGMAGARFVEELRERASEGFEITVLGDEPHGGYNRIMLSGVLVGMRDASDIVTHPLEWYDDRRVDLKIGCPAVAIDRERRVVHGADGSALPYDALVFATGSRPFVPPLRGLSQTQNVFVFRTLADCERIRTAAATAATAVVLGGGLLGLEAAAGLRALGIAPTVVHLMPTLMDVQLDPLGGSALAAKIEALGIAVRTGARAAAAYDDARGRGIELDDGTVVAGDLIVVCCGTVPNAELARDAGIACGRGIVVDDALRTSDERIFALGECAEHRGQLYGLVEPLWEQCRTLADRLVGGTAVYEGSKVGTRLKVAGINVVAVGERDARPGDEVILALGSDGGFRRAIARDGRLAGAQVVGDAAAAAAFARAFERGTPLPGSLAAFVFGVDGIGAASAGTSCAPGDRICVCNEVSRGEILDAIAAGAHDVAEIGRRTMAGTGCGTCRGELAALVIGAAAATAEA